MASNKRCTTTERGVIWVKENNDWRQKQKEQEPVLGREARMQHLRDEIKELLAEDEEQDDKR